MAQLMPLPLTVSCFNKIQIGFTFLVPAHLGRPGQRALKRACVCVLDTRTRKPTVNLTLNLNNEQFATANKRAANGVVVFKDISDFQ